MKKRVVFTFQLSNLIIIPPGNKRDSLKGVLVKPRNGPKVILHYANVSTKPIPTKKVLFWTGRSSLSWCLLFRLSDNIEWVYYNLLSLICLSSSSKSDTVTETNISNRVTTKDASSRTGKSRTIPAKKFKNCKK
jgi:hypothetical protein